MNTIVKHDMLHSRNIFERLGWPKIAPLIGGGRYVSLEGRDSEIADLLDIKAGIDGLQVDDANGYVRTIAVRMQGMDNPASFKSFTIRHLRHTGTTTEFEKRLGAYQHKNEGWLMPAITIQGYYYKPTGELLSIGAISTYELYAWVGQQIAKHGLNSNPCVSGIEKQDNTNDGNIFIIAYWSIIQRHGLAIKIYEASNGGNFNDGRWD